MVGLGWQYFQIESLPCCLAVAAKVDQMKTSRWLLAAVQKSRKSHSQILAVAAANCCRGAKSRCFQVVFFSKGNQMCLLKPMNTMHQHTNTVPGVTAPFPFLVEWGGRVGWTTLGAFFLLDFLTATFFRDVFRASAEVLDKQVLQS